MKCYGKQKNVVLGWDGWPQYCNLFSKWTYQYILSEFSAGTPCNITPGYFIISEGPKPTHEIKLSTPKNDHSQKTNVFRLT